MITKSLGEMTIMIRLAFQQQAYVLAAILCRFFVISMFGSQSCLKVPSHSVKKISSGVNSNFFEHRIIEKPRSDVLPSTVSPFLSVPRFQSAHQLTAIHSSIFYCAFLTSLLCSSLQPNQSNLDSQSATSVIDEIISGQDKSSFASTILGKCLIKLSSL